MIHMAGTYVALDKCTECGSKDSVTRCDKCGEPVCQACSRILLVKKELTIRHDKCMPYTKRRGYKR